MLNIILNILLVIFWATYTMHILGIKYKFILLIFLFFWISLIYFYVF